MYRKNTLLLSLILMSTYNCLAQKKHHLTVFIHGTVLPVPYFSALYKSITGESTENGYDLYLDELRYEPHYQMQLIGERGLHKIDIKHYDQEKKRYSAICFEIAQIYHDAHLKINGPNQTYSYYLFGWLGKLCAHNRLSEGKALFNALAQEVARLHELEPETEIEITLISHSHGGNVALNIVQGISQSKLPFTVENLILMGTPLQQETTLNAHHPIFNNIYTIYSTGDWIQKIDIFSSKDRGGKRSFHKRKNQLAAIEHIPNNVYDIEIIIDGYKPTHSELWLTSGIPSLFYRKNFPLNPYPIVTLVPFIKNAMDRHKKYTPHIKMDIKKREQLSVTLFDKLRKRNLTTISF